MNKYDEKRRLFREQLRSELQQLNNARKTLLYSYEKCKNIDPDSVLSSEELESYEALTSRFARVSDILTQKVLKTVFLLLQEPGGSFIDKTNMAEKYGIIPDARELRHIRELRNEIAHEYRVEHIEDIFKDVLEYTPVLIAAIREVTEYSELNLFAGNNHD